MRVRLRPIDPSYRTAPERARQKVVTSLHGSRVTQCKQKGTRVTCTMREVRPSRQQRRARYDRAAHKRDLSFRFFLFLDLLLRESLQFAASVFIFFYTPATIALPMLSLGRVRATFRVAQGTFANFARYFFQFTLRLNEIMLIE